MGAYDYWHRQPGSCPKREEDPGLLTVTGPISSWSSGDAVGSYLRLTIRSPGSSRDRGPTDNRQISRPLMYFLARPRETIARTLEPTTELDSRNVSGPLTDRRPCCQDHTLYGAGRQTASSPPFQSLADAVFIQG